MITKVHIKLKRDLPGIQAPVEWFYPCEADEKGGWIGNTPNQGIDEDMKTILKAISPSMAARHPMWFEILDIIEEKPTEDKK
jgi:hypothetical protein